MNSFIMKIRDGEIIVSTPLKYDETKFNDFLTKRLPSFASSSQDRRSQHCFLGKNTYVTLLGKKRDIKVFKEEERTRIHISFKSKSVINNLEDLSDADIEIIIKINESMNEKYILDRFRRKFTKHFFHLYEKEANIIAKNYKKKIKELRFQNLTGSWGICHASQSRVTLAYALIPYSYHVQRYIIVHEVAHLLEQNHSTNFWSVVKLQCPDYKLLRKELKW